MRRVSSHQKLQGIVCRAEGVLIRKDGRLQRDAEDLLITAREAAAKLGMLSMGGDFQQSELRRRSHLMKLFDSVMPRGEPEELSALSDHYGRMSQQIGLEPGQIVAVEASPIGIDAAKEAGFFVLALATQSRYHHMAHADLRVGSYATAGAHISDLVTRH